MERCAWNNGDVATINDRTPLSFVNEQHDIVLQVAMERQVAMRQERLHSHRKACAGGLRGHLEDQLTSHRRSKLQDFAFLDFQNTTDWFRAHVLAVVLDLDGQPKILGLQHANDGL